MKIITLFTALLLFTCLSFAQTRNLKVVTAPTENPTNQKRKAVVIGMSDYGAGNSLTNTLNDADDMTAVLIRLGFEVTLLKDNNLRNLRANLTSWYDSIEGTDMAIFYFSGYRAELNCENYLIPVGTDFDNPTDVQYVVLNVNRVLNNMDKKEIGMKLLILDASLDNSFEREGGTGASIIASKDTYIAFGSTVQNGGQYGFKNSVFTHFLKQEILKEGVSIDEIFTNVTASVYELTGKQIPYRNSALTNNFYFIPK